LAGTGYKSIGGLNRKPGDIFKHSGPIQKNTYNYEKLVLVSFQFI
jgi:hypothetical protein